MLTINVSDDKFLFGAQVMITTKCGNLFAGWINGKIKDIDAYVVELEDFRIVDNVYGRPNRHLALEYGSFSGSEKEIIVLATEIRRAK